MLIWSGKNYDMVKESQGKFREFNSS